MTTCDTTSINTGNQQCLISGQYAQWANFFTTLPERFDHEGTVIYAQRIMHKDYTPGNILWDYANDGSINFALVDTNRMHFGPVPPLMAARNMARLWGPREFTECLSAEYARCRHWPAEPFTALTLRARRLFWHRYALRHPLPVTIE